MSHSPRRTGQGAAAVLLAWLASLSTGCNPAEPPPVIRPAASRSSSPERTQADAAPRVARPADYVGSARCAECHADIARTYAATTMGRSASIIGDAPVIETFEQPSVRAASGFHYSAEQTSAGMVHHERLLDEDGTVLYDQPAPIAALFGSGQRGRSYLIRRDDQFFMSPLTWYSTAAKWDLSPGYFERNHHFERRIVEGCAQCHVGRLAWAESGPPERVSAPGFLEASIGCERCHGPGERHIAWRRQHPSPEPAQARLDPIVNPANLAPHLRESICNECHLLGVERVLRKGRHDRDFRPGDDLSEIWVIFSRNAMPGNADVATEAVNQVPQMRSSRCFLASDGALGCTSCHDPHRQPEPGERIAFYRTRCLNCHSESDPCSMPRTQRIAQSAEDSCIACHMPKQPTDDVPHTSQTDHRILRRVDQKRAVPSSTGETFTLFPGMERTLSPAEQNRARGLLMSRFAREMHDIALAGLAVDVLEPLAKTADDDPDYWRAIGDVYAVQGLSDRAHIAWRRALELAPTDEAALRSLAISLHDAGQFEHAAELFDRYLKSNGWDRVVLGRQVHALGQLLRLDEARTLAETGVQRFPWDYRLREWLADACRSSGQLAEAEQHRKIVQRLKPAP